MVGHKCVHLPDKLSNTADTQVPLKMLHMLSRFNDGSTNPTVLKSKI